MKSHQRQKDILFSVIIFFCVFAVNLLIQKIFITQTLVPMIFVFGVFLISLKTHGYLYGITSAIVSVFAVNFAFTYPYYAFDFFVEESIFSAVIMLIVAVSTSTLNIRIREQEMLRVREQEKLRSESEKERMRGNLLRAISHDLRTPLTSIYGSTSTLISKYDALPKEQQLKLLGEIQEDASHHPDLIILDLGLPDRDGLDLIQEVRESDTVPIIVLSARSNERDKVTALDLGANDYITKPFGTEELLARIRAVLRSHRQGAENESTPSGKYQLQDLLIDYDKRQVFVGKDEIDLTQTEYNIIAYLSIHAGKVLTYAAIIRAVWGYSDYGSVKKLQVNMKNIRKKMGVTPGEKRYIINELGVGYRMLEDDK